MQKNISESIRRAQMKNNNYKPQIPDVMEAIFDAAYLIFDLIAAILFFLFSKGNVLLFCGENPHACVWDESRFFFDLTIV